MVFSLLDRFVQKVRIEPEVIHDLHCDTGVASQAVRDKQLVFSPSFLSLYPTGIFFKFQTFYKYWWWRTGKCGYRDGVNLFSLLPFMGLNIN